MHSFEIASLEMTSRDARFPPVLYSQYMSRPDDVSLTLVSREAMFNVFVGKSEQSWISGGFLDCCTAVSEHDFNSGTSSGSVGS